jgi:hypothetical protein
MPMECVDGTAVLCVALGPDMVLEAKVFAQIAERESESDCAISLSLNGSW